MATSYNRIAGQSIERLAALSDGIFAVAMTLLVLDLRTPARESVRDEASLWRALVALAPQLLPYLMSFLTLGIFWNGQQAQLDRIERGNRYLAWIHIAFLAAVSMMPLSTRLLTEFIGYRIALLCYWVNLLMLGLVLLASWRYAIHARLVAPGMAAEVGKAIERRIYGGQLLYAIGAALCVFDPYASIVFIVLVQINFAVAPRIRWLSGV